MTTNPERQQWLIMAPDHEGILAKRMEVRSKHFEEISLKKQADAACQIKVAGATLDEPIAEGSSLKINGSYLIASADSKEDVIKLLKDDIYTKAGVWNWNKLQIVPIKTAFINP